MASSSICAILRVCRLALFFGLGALQGCGGAGGHGDNDFIKAGEVTRQEAEDELLAELVSTFRPGAQHHDRIAELEAAVAHMFGALPKDQAGRVGHNAVRYALHRLLLQEHGWFVKGLEPEGPSWNNSSSRRLQEWVPSYLQEVLERRSGSSGFTLRELAVLAATIEDLVHREAIERLRGIYRTYNVPEQTLLDAKQSEELIDSFIMIYLRGGNFTARNADQAWRKLLSFKSRYSGWKDVDAWARQVQLNASGSTDGSLNFERASVVAEAIGANFGRFNDGECSDLKRVLMSVEASKPGRVRLSTFYNLSLHSHWQFTEKISYLRDIGALDESVPEQPMVIVPNYVGSRPQCLEPSHFYAICCRNECEDFVAELERQVASPSASTQRIVEIVSDSFRRLAAFRRDYASDGASPQDLSQALLSRLDQVASANGGEVPLHGRLFAQWMHHAFPRECPYPHESGTINPQTPDEWLRDTGHTSTQASEEEMVCHVTGPCAGGAQALSGSSAGDVDGMSDMRDELPWSDTEELLVVAPGGQRAASARAATTAATAQQGESPGGHGAGAGGDFFLARQAWEEEVPQSEGLTASVEAFNTLLRSLVLAGVAIGLAVASRTFAAASSAAAGKRDTETRVAVGWYPTMLLFAFPLVVVTADYALGSSANELLLCGLCWGLAAMMAFQMRFRGRNGGRGVAGGGGGSGCGCGAISPRRSIV